MEGERRNREGKKNCCQIRKEKNRRERKEEEEEIEGKKREGENREEPGTLGRLPLIILDWDSQTYKEAIPLENKTLGSLLLI